MLAQLRSILSDANYSESAIAAALGLSDSNFGFAAAEVPLLLRRLESAGDGRLPTLIRLFVLGVAVSFDEAAQALRPLDIQTLRDLLNVADAKVQSPLRVTPYAGLVCA